MWDWQIAEKRTTTTRNKPTECVAMWSEWERKKNIGKGRNVGQRGVIICLLHPNVAEEGNEGLPGMCDVFWPIFINTAMFSDPHTGHTHTGRTAVCVQRVCLCVPEYILVLRNRDFKLSLSANTAVFVYLPGVTFINWVSSQCQTPSCGREGNYTCKKDDLEGTCSAHAYWFLSEVVCWLELCSNSFSVLSLEIFQKQQRHQVVTLV